MIKILKISALVFFLSLSVANAYNGGKRVTFQPNMDMKELENKAYYNFINAEYETKKVYSDGLLKCAENNKYYLPSHVSADSDGCYDVLAYLDTLALIGQESTMISNISLTGSRLNNLKAEGVHSADVMCDAANPGTRAMRYDDIRYVLQTASLPTGQIIVFEGINDVDFISSKLVSSDGTVHALSDNSNVTCMQYSSNASTKHMTIDGKAFEYVDCSVNAKVVCVAD